MTSPPPASRNEPASQADRADQSLGQLVTDLTGDMQTLFRQEVELAKVEIRQEAVKAGKGAGMLGGAGFAAAMTAVLGSLAAVFALANWIGHGWSALIVAGIWAVIGGVLFAAGRRQLQQVSPVPAQTAETLKEDAEWARHPTR